MPSSQPRCSSTLASEPMWLIGYGYNPFLYCAYVCDSEKFPFPARSSSRGPGEELRRLPGLASKEASKTSLEDYGYHLERDNWWRTRKKACLLRASRPFPKTRLQERPRLPSRLSGNA